MGYPNRYTEIDEKGDYMKMNFEYFQIQKPALKLVRLEKVHTKYRFICLVFMLPS